MKLSIPTGEEHVDLDAVDLSDPDLYGGGDPHPIWHAMREREPVRRQQLPDGRGFFGEFHPAGPVEQLSPNFAAGNKRMPITATLCPGAAEILAAAGAEPVGMEAAGAGAVVAP